MINGMLETKGEKSQMFQLMLLSNNAGEVEVEETKQINFLRIQEHLKKGKSVFIMIKNSEKTNQNEIEMKTVKAFYVDHV